MMPDIAVWRSLVSPRVVSLYFVTLYGQIQASADQDSGDLREPATAKYVTIPTGTGVVQRLGSSHAEWH